MAVEVVAPTPRVVTVIDYDITLACGKEIEFTVRPDLGDTEDQTGTLIILVIGQTKHRVEITRDQIAVLSRRERDMRLAPEKFEPSDAAIAGAND